MTPLTSWLRRNWKWLCIAALALVIAALNG